MEGKTFWLISAPKTREDTFNTLNKKTADENDLCVHNYKFQVPDLKVGTLDSQMALSDTLEKTDNALEAVVKKIANQLFDILELKSGENKYDHLTVNNNSVDKALTFFRWDEAKYPTTQSLKQLVDTIVSGVTKLDDELKVKSSEFTTLVHTLNAEERKMGGNLMSRDISDLVQKYEMQSEYMENAYVAVPKYFVNQWNTVYEKLVEFVLPRSSELVDQDTDICLFRVILFKRDLEEFKSKCRENKFTVRDYSNSTERSKKPDRKKLDAEREKQKKALIRWCKTNFSEAFIAWIHLKAIRVFVESVLRYGLPTNFQAMLLLPQKKQIKRLRQTLLELYGHLSSKIVFSGGKQNHEEDDPMQEKFFPYVFLEINLDFKRQQV